MKWCEARALQYPLFHYRASAAVIDAVYGLAFWTSADNKLDALYSGGYGVHVF